MTVKEMIEKLQGMNQEAIVIVDDDWKLRENSENGIIMTYHIEQFHNAWIDEIEQSDDKKYVRLW